MRTAALVLLLASFAAAQKPRARDLGVPFDGTPGPRNAITDIRGVEVGHATIIRGDGKLVRGQGPVRTGVTAVFPRGKGSSGVFSGWFSQNGNGEMTGTTWIDEAGQLDGPVLITNTTSVGTVRDAYIAWQVDRSRDAGLAWLLPVVAETYDGFLNDIHGFHVKPEHVRAALDGAAAGPVAEGNTGGGTGMICFGFKGGIGTSSRKVGDYTVGVLVQCNCGRRPQLTIAGVPVGREIGGRGPFAANQPGLNEELGSIIIVVATDAPLLPHQLKRLARRATMGLARTGATSGNGSGDIFIAFSTANEEAARERGIAPLRMLVNGDMNGLFEATVQATEEAIVNSMIAAETMTGVDGHTVERLPHDKLREALKKYGR